ncbi:hypothetical protein SSP35_16_00240 [Streptomyces sp. NBRC 110611]|nr:hypothetical protein [Streptomyces sp. NBRC 110611]GAU70029.1 hypothetical protein SSP35_16_00240 [Streptomyces sp. NBRC 110611]
MVHRYGEKATFNFVTAEYANPVKPHEHFVKHLGVQRQEFFGGWHAYVRG